MGVASTTTVAHGLTEDTHNSSSSSNNNDETIRERSVFLLEKKSKKG